MTKSEIKALAAIYAKYDACLLGEPFAFCGAFTDKKTCVECYSDHFIRKFGITNEKGKHVKNCECQVCWDKRNEEMKKKVAEEKGEKFICSSHGCSNPVDSRYGICQQCMSELPF